MNSSSPSTPCRTRRKISGGWSGTTTRRSSSCYQTTRAWWVGTRLPPVSEPTEPQTGVPVIPRRGLLCLHAEKGIFIGLPLTLDSPVLVILLLNHAVLDKGFESIRLGNSFLWLHTDFLAGAWYFQKMGNLLHVWYMGLVYLAWIKLFSSWRNWKNGLVQERAIIIGLGFVPKSSAYSKSVLLIILLLVPLYHIRALGLS